MTNPPAVELTASPTSLPTITPHLMPFHIEYTGPAPLSTYFLVKPAPPQYDPGLVERVKARFVAAFRGRAMHGVAVAPPDGFSGVVLSSQDKVKRRENEYRKKGRRSARKSKQDDVQDDESGNAMLCDKDTDDEANTDRVLRPTAKFTSFTLWNADVNADEQTDEYLRFLTEYQRLSTEIHRIL